MNTRYRQYVTDVAFRMTLGKTHITALQCVKEGTWTRAHEMGLWHGASHALAARGLITCLEIFNKPGDIESGWNDNIRRPFHERYKLTEEGELVWKLLLLAGLVEQPVKQSKARKAAA